MKAYVFRILPKAFVLRKSSKEITEGLKPSVKSEGYKPSVKPSVIFEKNTKSYFVFVIQPQILA